MVLEVRVVSGFATREMPHRGARARAVTSGDFQSASREGRGMKARATLDEVFAQLRDEVRHDLRQPAKNVVERVRR